MHLRLTFLLCYIFLATNSFAQENTIIHGTIICENQLINNVHIINLNNGRGTISNDNGSFEINTKANDTLLFSSIQFERKKIRITNELLSSKEIIIELVTSVTMLNEVTITHLTGDLYVDIKGIPEDTTPKHNFVYKLSDLYINLPEDQHGYKGAPNVGISPAGGVNIASFFDGKSAMNRILKRKLSKKQQFPIKLRKAFGDYYFITYLKIPKYKIHNFITYCEYRNISQKFDSNKLLEIIEILKEESISYNEIKD